MSEIEITHSESWTLVITTGDEETWPDCEVPGLTRGQMMRPTRIRVHLRRGDHSASLSITGQRLKQDGQPGERKVVAALYSQAGYDWVHELAEQARRLSSLGPGRTGVGW